MLRPYPALSWSCTLAAGVAALLLAHAWRWPRRMDVFSELRASAAALSSRLPADSPVAIRMTGLPEEHFNYLRYALIPRPLELSVPAARRLILLSDRPGFAAASARLQRERPGLIPDTIIRERSYLLALYRAAP